MFSKVVQSQSTNRDQSATTAHKTSACQSHYDALLNVTQTSTVTKHKSISQWRMHFDY